MSDLKKAVVTFATGGTLSDIVPVPAATNENGGLAVVGVDLHSGFSTATAVEIRFGVEQTATSCAARYDKTGTLISFAGAASRSVSLEPAENACVKNFVQMASNVAITTGGQCTIWFREV